MDKPLSSSARIVGDSEPRCPDCGTPLRQIDARPGKQAWACPVGIEAQRRGILGQPGRKHTAVTVYVPKERT
jgi:hypothetical protein